MKLTLLIDQGEDVQGQRWQAHSEKFPDLESALAQTTEQALVILGPPGSGKSTLLRNFELEASRNALHANPDPDQARYTLFVQLGEYKAVRSGEPLPQPDDWLQKRWSTLSPDLPGLETLLQQGRMTLLLDAVNEIPASGSKAIRLWKDFLASLAQKPAGNRILFSCRSLDYSASLSTRALPVPQLRIEPLSDSQVRRFVEVYAREHAQKLWGNLKDSKHLDLFRSPYYLQMLVDQSVGGEIPEGRAGLFTGFIRQLLGKEIQGESPLFQPGFLLTKRDILRLNHARRWKSPSDLPEAGLLVPKLGELAYRMQLRRSASEGGQVRIDYDTAVELLQHESAADIIKAGVDLDLLIHDLERDEILYIHQLMQEYFAARVLAKSPQPDLVRQAWKSNEVSPSLEESRTNLPDSDPLPPLEGSGWEESTLLAAAISADSGHFIEKLMATNLALAGRCAAQPDISVSQRLKSNLAQALIERTRNSEADPRARIAAGLALGNLGDPRFRHGRGPDGETLLPRFIEIPRGSYTIGSDEGLYDDEAPVHAVTLEAFALGQFPVTNAEWRLFMAAGAYENERWWQSEAAQAWRRGENSAEGAKQQERENRDLFQKNFDQIRVWHNDNRITSKQADDWQAIARMNDAEFETQLNKWFPPGRQTEPRFWDDDLFNNPAQPVVGICWFEALAYCAWLGAQTGQDYRLPAEAEWEAAARGFESRRYAWGDEFDSARCNTFESHIRRTTPVGIFPGGESPEGLIDLSGNIWEWTRTLYKAYPSEAGDGADNPDSSDGRRVVRGGSWFIFQDSARASCRFRFSPGCRYYGLGFRLCCPAPII